MSTENTPPTIYEKIATYFDTQIGFKEFAQQIRRSNHILSGVMMQPDADQNVVNSDWIIDCFYHLNEFAELLDPVLEKDWYAVNPELPKRVSDER